MRIAVVIPTLHEADRVQEAIRSVRATSAPGSGDAEIDVIVADGGSRDATCERARSLGALVVDCPSGRARQLQRGLQAAQKADVVLFLHADTTLPAGFADRVREALADPDVVGGAFGLRFSEPGRGLRVVEWGVRRRLAWFGLPFGDQALFARREDIQAVGGVPQVPLLEDVDLVRALRKRGRLALIADSVSTSARRYRERGIVRSVLRNFAILMADRVGVSRERLARWYRR